MYIDFSDARRAERLSASTILAKTDVLALAECLLDVLQRQPQAASSVTRRRRPSWSAQGRLARALAVVEQPLCTPREFTLATAT